MNRSSIEDSMFPKCPVRNILARICDKWSLLVLYTLDMSGENSLRFKELKRRIPDISQKMLTTTLRTMEEDGFIKRSVYPAVPVRVEYELTPRAKSLRPHLDGLLKWAINNMDTIMTDRKTARTQIQNNTEGKVIIRLQ